MTTEAATFMLAESKGGELSRWQFIEATTDSFDHRQQLWVIGSLHIETFFSRKYHWTIAASAIDPHKLRGPITKMP